MSKQKMNFGKTPREILKDMENGKGGVEIPDSFYQSILEQLLERDYLNYTSDKKFVKCSEEAKARKGNIRWMRVTRLPIHPNENENYNLLARWQGVLSSIHAWGYRLVFLLMRVDGKTKLFLGTIGDNPGMSPEEAIEQMKEAVFGSMPGMGLEIIPNKDRVYEAITEPLSELDCMGAITGIPSFRKEDEKVNMQTLDQLAFGIRDIYDYEEDYAVMVIADPIEDKEISDIITRYRELGSKIHTNVKTTLNRSEGDHEDDAVKGFISVMGTIFGVLLCGEAPHLGAMIGSSISQSFTTAVFGTPGNNSIGAEYLDKFAEYAESACDHHVERLISGRNLGFWNAGVYVFGKSKKTVMTVNGMLRSVYSGDETYYEPIRMHFFSDRNAIHTVRNNYELLPMVNADVLKYDNYRYQNDEWHIFGKRYQYVSTPVNTKEMSLLTSLPRRDVPGLRFVKTAVRFANNPAQVQGDNKISLGNIVDTGIVSGTTYDIDINSLVRHALVTGSTGSGKSTTCKKLVSEVMSKNVPVMIIEPAKDDYVRWAIEQNKHLPDDKRFKIYMPGLDKFDGVKLEQLHINLYEPAAAKGAKVDILQHSETTATLLNACLPSEDVVPILIEEVVYETIRDYTEGKNCDIDEGETQPLKWYPDIADMRLQSSEIMEKKEYMDDNKQNLTEVLVTRFKSLERGTKGKVLNVAKSVNYSEMFSGNVIINISRLAGSKDKSLIMSLLMQALYEYRISLYTNNDDYRRKAQSNKLMHLLLIEEAHNVLVKPEKGVSSGNPQKAAADLFGNMLSEMRGYGQGFVIVDQVPTRLIDDAVKNTNYKIVHRLISPDDQKLLSSCMALRDDQKYIIPALEKGNAIICGDEDDAAIWVKIPKVQEYKKKGKNQNGKY